MFIKRLFTGALFFLLATSVFAQTQHRFKDMIFKDVTIDENINYSNSSDKKAHLFDVYQPHDDTARKRPLIIWMHGGGFKFGSKEAKGIKMWSNTFAQRGYVCVAINYSMSKRPAIFGISVSDLQKSTYYAVQDLKQAIEYFKVNAEKYKIDTSKIILGGNSAGGIMALQAAFSNNAELGELVGLTNGEADMHSKEFLNIAGVINFWGAIFDIHWLKNAKTPIVQVYGNNDGTIDPGHKGTAMYGAASIHKEADELKIPNAVKVYEGYSHELQKHFNPIFSPGKDTEERWAQAGQFAADFLYEQLFEVKPKKGAKPGATTLDYRTMWKGTDPKATKPAEKKKPETTTEKPKPAVEKPKTAAVDTGTTLDYRTMWPSDTKPAAKKKPKN